MKGVAVEKLLLSKSAKTESCQDALQTIFSDMNRMRQSVVGRVSAGASGDWCRYRDPVTSQQLHLLRLR
jgi:hypothetical protein